MYKHSLPRRRRGPAVLAALTALLILCPATASAANTLSLSIEPAIPGKGKPFLLKATGNSEQRDPISGGGNELWWGFGPGTEPCASTVGLEFANTESENANRVELSSRNLGDGPFDERATYSGGATSISGGYRPRFALNQGLAAGHYHACGYMTHRFDRDEPPIATSRLEFTVGGTCETATAKYAKALSDRKAAKRAVKRARKARRAASTPRQRRKAARALKAAKRTLKKANRRLTVAAEDRAALCRS